jgi:peptide/nickel transport system permease protein
MLKRALRSIITLIVVLVFVFAGARLSGNPFTVMFPDGITNKDLEAFNRQFGLDKSLPDQFGLYLINIAQGDFGISIAERRPVTQIFAEAVLETLKLGVWALAISCLLGLAVGIFCAIKPRSIFSSMALLFMGMGYAVPSFIIAIFLILAFSYHLHILPSKGGESALSYIMPVIALSAHPIATIARYTRSSLLEVLEQEYLRTARAKGLRNLPVILKHALPNALIPVITIIGILVTDIAGGSIIVESVFSWPGIGKRLVDAVLDRDFPVIQFGVVCFSLVVITVNFIVDVLYVVVDPRIRVET